nr:AC5 protein [Tomato leaf curl virus]
MMISAGRFAIVLCSKDKDEISDKIVADCVWGI